MLRFTAVNLGKFDYKVLMSDYNFEFDENSQSIIDKYTTLDLKKKFFDSGLEIENDVLPQDRLLYQKIKGELLSLTLDKDYIVNTLIKYLYEMKQSSYKTTLWSCFGDVIIKNLQNNIQENTILCEQCGVRVVKTGRNTIHCADCAKIIQAEQKKKWKENQKNK